MVDFRTLLSVPADEVKAPIPLPRGTYFGIIKSFTFGESREKKTPFVKFDINLTGPGEDIDLAEVAEIDWAKKIISRTYYITTDSMILIKNLAESCSIPTAGRSMGEIIPDCIQQPVMVELDTRPDPNDPEKVYTDVKKVVGQP